MMRILTYLFAAAVILHGLIHLMGLAAYWPLTAIAELPYKTTLLGGRWDVAQNGMRLFSVLWLIAASGFILTALMLIAGQGWWFPLLGVSVLLSLAIAILDWGQAHRGAILDILLLVPLLLVLGLRIQPRAFTPYPASTPELASTPLPAALPPPVARFFKAATGEQVPVISSAVITGRGTLRFAGVTFPGRLRFTHDAGQGYRHYIEATLFGLPLLKVNERYLDGQARMALPMGVIEDEPKVDLAANLGLWGESIWLPSVYLTDARVRWEPLDDDAARLVVPSPDGEDAFTVSFDPATGLIRSMEALRYREATDTEKIPWRLEVMEWGRFHGILVPTRSSVTWVDEGTPWLVVELDDVVYNVPVEAYIRAEGP